jgi:putative transposase
MSPDSDSTQASGEVPEAVWQRMEPVIPPRKRQEGRPQRVDLQRITEGIFSGLRPGLPWPACPRERVGPPSPVSYSFRPWVAAGVFGHVWAEALTVYDDLQGLEWTWQSGDGAVTKAPVGARPRAPSPRTVASAGRSAGDCRRGQACPWR